MSSKLGRKFGWIVARFERARLQAVPFRVARQAALAAEVWLRADG